MYKCNEGNKNPTIDVVNLHEVNKFNLAYKSKKIKVRTRFFHEITMRLSSFRDLL